MRLSSTRTWRCSATVTLPVLEWGSAFDNLLIVPPGSGIVHQVSLEYLARVVFNNNGVLYPTRRWYGLAHHHD